MSVIVYTDGSRIGPSVVHEGGPAGLGYVVTDGDSIIREFSLGFKLSTNNRMEMLAAIMVLESFERREYIHIITDSEYVIKSMTEWSYNWRRRNWITKSKKPVKNLDLILRLQKLMMFHRVQFSWVRGHTGNPFNERCDELARNAARYPTETDAGYLMSIHPR